jgi:hypothetical protein
MLPPECEIAQGGGGPNWRWSDYGPGIYMYDIRFSGTGDEPFWDAMPEFEILSYNFNRFITNPYERELVTCAAWRQPKFPGDQFSVTNSAGNYFAPVRLFDGPTVDQFLFTSRDSVLTIEAHEDDTNTPCSFRGGGSFLQRINSAISLYESGTSLWKAGVKLTRGSSSQSVLCSGQACNESFALTGAELFAFGKAILKVGSAMKSVAGALENPDDNLGIAMTQVVGSTTDYAVTMFTDEGSRGTARVRIKNTPVGQP